MSIYVKASEANVVYILIPIYVQNHPIELSWSLEDKSEPINLLERRMQ